MRELERAALGALLSELVADCVEVVLRVRDFVLEFGDLARVLGVLGEDGGLGAISAAGKDAGRTRTHLEALFSLPLLNQFVLAQIHGLQLLLE